MNGWARCARSWRGRRLQLLDRIGAALLDCYADPEVREDLTETIEQIDEQLTWLRDGLVSSWGDPESRGRILVLHHPPYVTEASKGNQEGQTLAMRHQLRQVLNRVPARVGSPAREGQAAGGSGPQRPCPRLPPAPPLFRPAGGCGSWQAFAPAPHDLEAIA